MLQQPSGSAAGPNSKKAATEKEKELLLVRYVARFRHCVAGASICAGPSSNPRPQYSNQSQQAHKIAATVEAQQVPSRKHQPINNKSQGVVLVFLSFFDCVNAT